jgi:hypothetical protein
LGWIGRGENVGAGVHAVEYVGAVLDGGVVVPYLLYVGVVEAVILQLGVMGLFAGRAGAYSQGAEGMGVFLHQRGYLEFLEIDHAASSLNIFIAQNQISICIRNHTCTRTKNPPFPSRTSSKYPSQPLPHPQGFHLLYSLC